MDELIYKFLIQSGYPRSSIVSKLTSGILTSKSASNGSIQGSLDQCITCIIVDPITADYLSVIAVVGASDAETLNEAGSACALYATRLDQYKLQCFVIRVDIEAHESDDQVQFFRVDDDQQLVPLSVQSFPDIDSLRVSRLLALKQMSPVVEIIDSTSDDESQIEANLPTKRPLSMYVPGVLLLLTGVLNWVVGMKTESALLDSGTINLLIGAAFLLTMPSLLRYYRG